MMKKEHKLGIISIAEQLGVSPATVSRALNPSTAGLVKEATRAKILELVDKLKFTPNQGARYIRKGVNRVLTVVIPNEEHVFFSEYYGRMLSGILQAASRREWDVRISALRDGGEGGFLESMQYAGMNSFGVIYLSDAISREHLEDLKRYRRPFVLLKSTLPVGGELGELAGCVVGVDNFAGAVTAASFVQQLGHTRVGLILGPEISIDAQDRKAGYLEALRSAGREPRPEHIHSGLFNHETGRIGCAKLLATEPRPTAICCANDEIAFGAIDAVRSAGLRCPEDVSVIGFDDGPWALAAGPKLTTIRQPLADLAGRAVGLLVEMASGVGLNEMKPLPDLPTSLVIRDSTCAYRG